MRLTRARWLMAGSVLVGSWLLARPQPDAVPEQAGQFRSSSAETVLPVPRHGAASGPGHAREALLLSDSDPFAVTRTDTAPAPPVAVAAEPATASEPQVPPVRFRHLGSMTDISGTTLTYLGRDEQVLHVKPMDIIDEDYRVESVDASEVAIVHLPTNTKLLIKKVSAGN